MGRADERVSLNGGGYKRAREVGYGRRAHSERARKTAGRNDFDDGKESEVQRLAGRENGAPRAVKEAEGGLEEACREPPCGDGSDGEAVREVHRRAAGVEKARREEG